MQVAHRYETSKHGAVEAVAVTSIILHGGWVLLKSVSADRTSTGAVTVACLCMHPVQRLFKEVQLGRGANAELAD